MNAIVLVAIGILCAVGASGETKIVNGDRAGRFEFLWYVAFFYEGYNVEGNELFCGGTIINMNYILSAAHCFYGYNDLEPYYLAAGKYKLNETSRSEQWRNISSFTIHPKFDNDTYENDIIVVKVDVPFVFNRFVQPVILSNETALPKKQTCLMPGLGWVDERTKTMAETLQKYEVKFVSNKKCKDKATEFGVEDTITSRVYCTKNKKQGACYYDSGGPVGCYDTNGYHTLVAVRSWTLGNQQCKKGWNVMMNVAKYLGFIEKTIMSEMDY